MPSTESRTPEEFPRCLEELDSEWLGRALGCDVVSFTADDIGSGKGMMGDVFRLSVAVSDSERIEIVAKFSAKSGGTLSVERRAQIVEREINFYREIAPRMLCRTPRIYGSWSHASSAEFLILMEYIESDSSVSQLNGISFEHSCSVMKELAALHSAEVEKDAAIGRLSHVCSDHRRHYQQEFARSGWARVSSLLMELSFVPKSENEIAERVGEAYRLLGRQESVLCHADVRPDNILFERSAGGVTLIDWQGVSLGPRAWDVGYYLAQGLRPCDRRDWQNRLIDLYISEANLDRQDFDRSAFAEAVAKMGWYSLAIACSLHSLSDPTAVATTDLARSMGARAVEFLVDSGEW